MRGIIIVGEDDKTYEDGESILVKNGMEFKLDFIQETNKATILFDNDDQNQPLEVIGYGKQVLLPADITKQHYTLLNYSNSSGAPIQAGATITVIDDVIYTAQWTGEVYTVTLNNTESIKNYQWLNAEEGQELESIQLEYTIQQATTTLSPQTGIYQYALGQKLSDLQITETALGVSGVAVAGEFKFVEPNYLPTTNTSVQITFVSSDNNYKNSNFYLSISVITIGVTFYSNGGSAVPYISGEHGQPIDKPADPTRAHYDFAGWFKDEDLTVEVDWDTFVLTQNENFYAKWTVKSYTVSYSTSKLMVRVQLDLPPKKLLMKL